MHAAMAYCATFGFAGIFAVLGAVFVYDGLWSRPRFAGNRCPRCGYDLVGLLGRKRCPECGDRFLDEDETIRVKHSRDFLEVAAGLVLLMVFTIIVIVMLRAR